MEDIDSTASSFVCDSSPTFMKWALRFVYSTILLVGLVGNGIVCTAVIRRKRMRTSINLFTFNLAFSDLIIIVIYVPNQMIAHENCQMWILGNFMCHVVYLVLPLCVSTSIGSLLVIMSDRYRAIVYPMNPKLTTYNVKVIIGVIWFASALATLPLALVVGVFRPGPNQVHCTEIWPEHKPWGYIYWIAIFVLQYLIPLIVIVTLAIIMSYKLRTNLIPVITRSGGTDVFARALRKRIKQTRKITKMLIALVLLYAICLLPQHIVATFWYNFGNLRHLSYRFLIYEIVNVFPIANSALNAIAYGTLNKEFNRIFKGVLRPKCA